MVRARQLPHDEMLAKYTTCNMRGYLKDITSNYVGNAVELAELVVSASELINNSLGSVALKQRKTIYDPSITSGHDWIRHANADGAKSIINPTSV